MDEPTGKAIPFRRRPEIGESRRSVRVRAQPRLVGWIVAVSLPVAFAWVVAGKNLAWVDGIRRASGGAPAESGAAQTPGKPLALPALPAQPRATAVNPSVDFARSTIGAVRAPAALSPPYRESAGRTRIYRCIDQLGQSIHSDQPCGDVVEVREYDQRRPSTYAPGTAQSPASVGVDPPRTAVRQQARVSAPQTTTSIDPNRAVCDSIEAELDSIDDRMRRGYTSQQGERFRDRIRALKRAQHQAGCR